MLTCNILKSEHLDAGSAIQNLKLEHNTEIEDTRPLKYIATIFTNSGKNNEVLKRIEQARKAIKWLNSLFWSKYNSVNTNK